MSPARRRRPRPAKVKGRKPAAKAKASKPAAKPRVGKPAAPKARGSKPAAAKPAAPHSEGMWAEWFARAPGERRYWLVKSEPETYSFDDLMRAPDQTTFWDGVRNFAARNFLRDGMKLGDRVFFYHSSTDPQAIVGICEVVREGYPDDTAFDRRHPGFDPESRRDDPQWHAVDLRAVSRLSRPVTLAEIKARPDLAQMALVRIGRLSVTPVRAAEWDVICALGT
ncbi:MAG: EVE domain-containing protein [Gemmatimonadales bacterium]